MIVIIKEVGTKSIIVIKIKKTGEGGDNNKEIKEIIVVIIIIIMIITDDTMTRKEIDQYKGEKRDNEKIY